MTLLEQLRSETRSLHEQTEQLFYTETLQKGTLAIDEYIHLLHTHLIFHQSLEGAIDSHPAFFREYEPETRRKALWLQNDLAYLNESGSQPQPRLFADWTPVTLLGAAYVAEGSMLGGTAIWRMLQKNPAIQPVLAQARFYQGYGTETGNQWKRFGAFALKQGENHVEDVIAAAKQAFRTYQHIFLQLQPSTREQAKTL